eukprot:12886063-Prorocentrum_lima.AAC.1
MLVCQRKWANYGFADSQSYRSSIRAFRGSGQLRLAFDRLPRTVGGEIWKEETFVGRSNQDQATPGSLLQGRCLP